MKYFIGIVPPDELKAAITNIQNRFGDNRLEPHITLRPPVTPLDVPNWLDSIRTVCSRFKGFDIELVKTGFFGKRVLFIDLNSEKLRGLFKVLKKEITPFEPKEQQDNRPYHAHLTLGRTWCGFTKEDFEQMKIMADKLIENEPTLFHVDFIRVYHKPDHNKRYEKLEDISLAAV